MREHPREQRGTSLQKRGSKEEEGEGLMGPRQAGAGWVVQTFVGRVGGLGFKPEYGVEEPWKRYQLRSRLKNFVVSTLVVAWRRD